ncbi:hypothetical protein QBC37DRAFT_398688 [Rhypophila decipiens]|uniref:Flagellar basal-body/hook protein C-terminal domain-containing protein n=1 Tax=Rhypophila decipiens TaxID=261697 RepID=A0AAN6Y9Z9_9PEZI|nr:hypothetical protein QBC37DRAFT_398688 [Rhypophila decipiens]
MPKGTSSTSSISGLWSSAIKGHNLEKSNHKLDQVSRNLKEATPSTGPKSQSSAFSGSFPHSGSGSTAASRSNTYTDSKVDTVAEMTNMISTQRAYESNLAALNQSNKMSGKLPSTVWDIYDLQNEIFG